MRKHIVATGALIVAGAGYLTGILTAPKSGKETRNDIAKGTAKARIDAERKLKKLHSELQDLIKQGENRSKKLKDKAKKELDDALLEANKAKLKARELLSALHHGDAEDPNLQAVINEVKLAQKNLVTFLKKK